MKLELINLHPSLRPQRTKWLKVVRKFLKVNRYPARLRRIRQLNIVWVNDKKMAEVNWQFKRHHGPTDILTFDHQNGSGEILISLDTTRRHAKIYQRSWQDELTLYLAHGILHLSGFDDRGKKDRERMRREEERLLSKLTNE